MANQLIQDQASSVLKIKRSQNTILKRDIITMLRELMSRFYVLGSIDNETKDHFYKILRAYEKKIAVFITIKTMMADRYAYLIFASSFFFLAILYPILLGNYLNLDIWSTVISLGVSIISVYLSWISLPKSLNLFTRDKAIIWSFVFLVTSLIFLSLTVRSSGLAYFGVMLVTVFLLEYAILFNLFLLFSLIELFIRRWYVRRNPIAFIVDNYLEVLSLLSENPFDWTDRSRKQKILENLRDISNVISWYLPNYIKVQDNLVNPWYLNRLDKMVSTIRVLQTKILTLTEKDDSELIKNLTVQLMAFLSGYWGEFEIREMDNVTRPQKLMIVLTVTRKLIIAFVFLALFIGGQYFTNAIPTEIYNYAVIGSTIWAGIVIISLLDPSFGEYVSTMKDLSGIFTKKL